MKNSILLALLCIGSLATRAQKIIEKHIPFSPKNFVSMNFQISDSIHIITWKKDEVYIRSSINVNDNQNNDDYKMVFDETGSTVNVSAKLETDNIRRSRRDSGNNHDEANGWLAAFTVREPSMLTTGAWVASYFEGSKLVTWSPLTVSLEKYCHRMPADRVRRLVAFQMSCTYASPWR